MAIVDVIANSNTISKIAIADYLLNKSEITGQSGQADIPEHLARILVALMRPSSTDIIWDPLAGNGRLLVNCARYITCSKHGAAREATTEIECRNICGMETDMTHMRIGSMNMILNGIENPQLKILDIFPGSNIILPDEPSLIISNLFFTGTDSKMAVDEQSLLTENIRKEIVFLNLILQNLKPQSRAAVVVPDAILYSNQSTIKKIREAIVENCTLEAVIALPSRKDLLFSGGAMLIISKQAVPTSTAWFYKLPLLTEVSGKRFANGTRSSINIAEQYTIDTILNHLREKSASSDKTTGNHFYVTADQLRANGYSFNYNQYGLILKKQLAPIEAPLMHSVTAEIIHPEDNPINEEHFAKEIPIVKSLLQKQ